ncbi:MAG: threonylcarbamoyl-AMP synthase [Actinobacteria bacterium]|nr:threonylcarbamoyl-AMP synthase [Actinomycetota bacterium]
MLRIDITGGFSRGDVEVIAGLLNKGGLGIIPTDTVYGIAALATDEEAVGRLLSIKKRPKEKPLPLQSPSVHRVHDIAVLDREPGCTLAAAFWPGALTLVLDRKPGVELPFQEPDTVGVRVPDNEFCRALLEEAGYLVVPSANPAGEHPPATTESIVETITGAIDFLVDGGECPAGEPSTVVDISSQTGKYSPLPGEYSSAFQYDKSTKGLKVLRAGAITIEEITRAISGGTDIG